MKHALLSPYPIHLAEPRWSGIEPEVRRDHEQKVMYRQDGVDTAQIFTASEMYDTEPEHLVDVDLQSWTFGIRKAYVVEGVHYLCYSREHGLVALMTAKNDSKAIGDQTYIAIAAKHPRKGYDIFSDGTQLSGPEYFEQIRKRLAEAR